MPLRVALVLLAVSVLASAASAQRFGAPSLEGRAPFPCVVDAPGPAAPSRERPGREEIVEAMNAIAPSIDTCGTGDGTVSWGFAVRGIDAAVTGVQLIEASTPTPPEVELRCMELVACGARLPSFERETFTVTYPFRY